MNNEARLQADASLKFFTAELRKKLNTHLKKIVLFGSRARGNNLPSSDYDFMIILDQKNKKLIGSIRDTEVDFLNKFDNLAASLIYDDNEWQKKTKFPIGININKEGVSLFDVSRN